MAQLPRGWIWDPFRTLNLRDKNANFTCIEEAVSENYTQCRNPINLEDRERADSILCSMASGQPTSVHLGDALEKLAEHLLCSFHSDQKRNKVKEFSHKISYVEAELKEKRRLLSQIQDIQRDLDIAKREQRNLQSQLEAQEQLSSTLQSDLEDASKDLEEKRSQLENHDTSFRRLQTSTSSEISELEESLAATQSKLRTTETEHGITDANIQHLLEDLAAKQAEFKKNEGKSSGSRHLHVVKDFRASD